MKTNPVFEYLRIDYYSATPKYLQLANSLIKAIGDGRIKKDQVLPSINELSFEFEISRDTAEKGYKYLKKIGVLGSVPGKGYFVQNSQVEQPLKIFLLFNKLSPHKKIIYDAFVSSLGELASVDFYIYNNDFDFFKRLIQNTSRDYTHYVVIPHFMDGGENAHDVINTIPAEKLILLDKLIPGIRGQYGAVYENFEKDIYEALEQALPHLSKYHTIKIIVPAYTYYPREIVKGYTRFCQQYAFNYKVVHNIANEPIKEGEAYINLMEDDLVTLIEKILATKMKLGKHVGLISYNETPLKKVILNGITTISTDFQMMGEKTAQLILEKSVQHIEIPFSLTLRASL
ncbi:GntR family transcriptional regulator [Sediminibacterium soli]|uniref:GntR family transcriptional regulator n=1 Tax=Sediminibacterium soli TaxID=2698829 RepID=UPI00137B913E|nr:GntR family transcriptional regulator [Sediminibacterium soli]NCI46865.1 GntR family transcriptional regulator [Sediminibacterium soli]